MKIFVVEISLLICFLAAVLGSVVRVPASEYTECHFCTLTFHKSHVMTMCTFGHTADYHCVSNMRRTSDGVKCLFCNKVRDTFDELRDKLLRIHLIPEKEAWLLAKTCTTSAFIMSKSNGSFYRQSLLDEVLKRLAKAQKYHLFSYFIAEDPYAVRINNDNWDDFFEHLSVLMYDSVGPLPEFLNIIMETKIKNLWVNEMLFIEALLARGVNNGQSKAEALQVISEYICNPSISLYKDVKEQFLSFCLQNGFTPNAECLQRLKDREFVMKIGAELDFEKIEEPEKVYEMISSSNDTVEFDGWADLLMALLAKTPLPPMTESVLERTFSSLSDEELSKLAVKLARIKEESALPIQLVFFSKIKNPHYLIEEERTFPLHEAILSGNVALAEAILHRAPVPKELLSVVCKFGGLNVLQSAIKYEQMAVLEMLKAQHNLTEIQLEFWQTEEYDIAKRLGIPAQVEKASKKRSSCEVIQIVFSREAIQMAKLDEKQDILCVSKEIIDSEMIQKKLTKKFRAAWVSLPTKEPSFALVSVDSLGQLIFTFDKTGKFPYLRSK